MFDTAVVTALHETCPTVGAIVAGDYANQMVNQYNEEAIKSRFNPKPKDNLAYITRTQKSILQENLEEESAHSFKLKLRGPEPELS